MHRLRPALARHDYIIKHQDVVRPPHCTRLYSRFSLVIATHSHVSTPAGAFLELFQTVFPFPVHAVVLTDNGVGFARDFTRATERVR